MAIRPESEKDFIIAIPPLRVRRIIALSAAAFFLSFIIATPFVVGLSRTFQPATLMVAIIFGIPAALFLRLAYPPWKSLQKLSVQGGRIRYIPGGLERFSGEPSHEASIPADTSEIVFCPKLLEGLDGIYAPDGYRIIMQAAGKTVDELETGFPAHIDAAQLQKVADGITTATGLPVRFMQCLQSSGGVKKIPWVPVARKTTLKLSAGLMLGFLPFIGGGIVGYFFTQPTLIVLSGLALWLCELFLISLFGKHKWTRSTAIRALTTIFTFGASYGATAVFVLTVLRHR
jgi:hypothetical protein